jgi:leucyl-tRNA synthetase
MINSADYNGSPSQEAREKIVADLAKKGVAREKVQYKLRDWIFSRQHYWGEPIPIIHCQKCGAVPVPTDQLPVTLPEVQNYEPTDNGESPLAAIGSWVNTTCPKCGGPAKRETDTMPNWAGSSWYYLRYYDAKNNKEFAAKDKLNYWGEVDLYLGGMEHTTLHLLYSRFWHKFLYDQKLVPTQEPYKARRGQGIILAEDGNKMSKSKGNVVDPISIVNQGYGADALKLAIAFIAPYEQTTAWKPEIVPGTHRFLSRVWTLVQEYKSATGTAGQPKEGEILDATHHCIYKVSNDLENLNFNTAISALMEFTNELYLIKEQDKFATEAWEFALLSLVKLLAPFAPHITEELWQQLGQKGSVHVAEWPVHDDAYLVKNTVKIAIQINGKLRGEIEMPYDSEQSAVEEAAKLHENATQYLKDDIKKVFYVPNKLISFVV